MGNTIVCVSKQQKVAFCDSSLPFWKAICPFLWASDLKYKWNTAWKSVIYVVYSVYEVACQNLYSQSQTYKWSKNKILHYFLIIMIIKKITTMHNGILVHVP